MAPSRRHPPASLDDASADATVVVHALTPDSFFSDRFRIGPALGSGAMGRVVVAHDLVTGQDVALKVLHRERARDPETLERFRREAEILESIGHPGIVRVLAVGTASDGTPWLSLELLRGVSLKEHLTTRGPMEPLAIVPVLNTLCDALAAAHLRGVVHRDLKPENVLLVQGGEPPCKVLDFGLSRFTASKALTRPGSVLGTPRYMAPEQISSAHGADFRVDVFAVGVLLYEMLSGRSPYPAEDFGQLLGCVLEGRVVPLTEVRPDLPPAIAAVIERAMARDPDARFQTAGAIAEAFARAIGVRSGRSNLASAPELRSLALDGTPYDEGASPLVDPFATPLVDPRATLAGHSPLPGVPPAEAPRGETAPGARPGTWAPGTLGSTSPSATLRASAPPTERSSEPGSPARVSWPTGAEFTKPRARPLPERRRVPRRSGQNGWALFFLALAAVVVLAAGAGLALRLLTSRGRLPLPAAAMPGPTP